MTDERHDIVPAHLAVLAMRDNGYRNAAYAVAELIDNAIQAGAQTVEVIVSEKEQFLGQRTRRHAEQLAVLDNGCGMDAEVLRMALQFGNGTRLQDRSGIGRFGMGLPSASISQCTRVDVWSWTDGASKALHCYIDVDEIRRGEQVEVPEPTTRPIPERWRSVGSTFGDSGTLVVWSNLDRCVWKTATAIFGNSERIVGRMYRHFLDHGKAQIRFASFLEAAPDAVTEKWAVLNDPSYLLVPSSCPAPYDQEPMFLPYGECPEQTIEIGWNGQVHPVHIRFAYAKKEARAGYNPGAKAYGKHAAKNVGVSVVRAGRELELSQAWVIQYDPTERWWGVEIEFPPALDELFGVSNNKQFARNLSEVAEIDIEQLLAQEGKSIVEFKHDLLEDGDPMAPLLEIAQAVERYLNDIRRLLKAQRVNTGHASSNQPLPDSAEQAATDKTRDRQQNGFFGDSDSGESEPEDERLRDLEEVAEGLGLPSDWAASTLSSGLKFRFAYEGMEGPAFFSVRSTAGVIVVTLNTEHPAYRHLIELMEQAPEDADADELRRRLDNSLLGLKLLLTAWARYEDEQPVGFRKDAAQDARIDWGKLARQFLAQEG